MIACSTATQGSPIISVMPSASRCGRSAAPASGSSRPRNVGPASITVTLEPRRAKACPSSTPMAPAAEDRQRRRQLPRNRRLAVGPELDGVQAGDGRDRRGAAVGDHHGAARDELLASDRDRAQVRQCPFASKEPGPGRLHRGGRPAVVEVACHPQHACRDLGKVDGPFHARGGEDARAIGLAQRFARAKQGLGRHAAPVRALAADQLSLDDRQRQPAVLKARRDRFSGDATAETHDVKLLGQLPYSVTHHRRRAGDQGCSRQCNRARGRFLS